MSDTIRQQLRQQLNDALRARDPRRSDAIRQIETEVSKAKTAPGFRGEVDDALYAEVLSTYVKKMEKAHREYLGYGERGREMAEKLAFEVEFLSQWLPRKADESQTRAMVQAAIDQLGVTGTRHVGRVVGLLMKEHKDDLDGQLVKRIAEELLS